MTDSRVEQGVLAPPDSSGRGDFTTDFSTPKAFKIEIIEVEAPSSAPVGGTFTIRGTAEMSISQFNPIQSFKTAVIARSPTEDDLVVDEMGGMQDGDTSFFELEVKSGNRSNVSFDVDIEAQYKPVVGSWTTQDTRSETISITPLPDGGGGDGGSSDDGTDGDSNDGDSNDENEDGDGDDPEKEGLLSSLTTDQKIMLAGVGALAFISLGGNSDDD